MALIDKITEDKIKEAADIVSVISDWVKLRRSGVEYVGLCPFHDDHTPTNFKVNKNKQMYKCFACGKGGDVFTFLKDKAGLDYGDALRYLAQKFSVYVPDDDPKERERWAHIKPAKPRDVADVEPEKQTLIMPREWVSGTVKADYPCIFIEWLRSLPWSNEQQQRVNEMLWLYCVGRWKDGRVVFWYIDEQGNPRGGKLMTYQPNGKRYHEKQGEPKSTSWIHYQRGKNGQPLCDMNTYTYRHLLFGSHLLRRYPDSVVNIVESEKTAIVCAIAYGHPERNLWLACGGLNFFKLEHIKPLIDANRRIWLWPDKDGVAQWEAKMKDVLSDRVTMTTKFLTDNWIPDDGEKADVADIILRHIQHPDSIRTHTGDGHDDTCAENGATSAPTSDRSPKPYDVTEDEWQQHIDITRAIAAWEVEHSDDEPFIDPIELQDPRVREWRDKMSRVHSSGWGKWPKCKVSGVKSVAEILQEHPIIGKLL
jgi:hypothetical protein